MIYLLAVFLPPVYFMLKSRWVAASVTGAICFVAFILTLSMVGAIVGIPMWFVCSACAIWDLRKQLIEEQASVMAKKMAEAIRQPPTS